MLVPVVIFQNNTGIIVTLVGCYGTKDVVLCALKFVIKDMMSLILGKVLSFVIVELKSGLTVGELHASACHVSLILFSHQYST